ncbi:MAG: hypothetical protein ACRC2K_13145 [Clostridium sp.]
MNFKFKDEKDKLTFREALYWSKVFNSNIKIGTEIEFEGNKPVDRGAINRKLSPSNSHCVFDKYGVGVVKSDGSLSNGVEITTVGRRVYGFLEQYSMFKAIIDTLEDYEPKINGRAGYHNHVLLSYNNISNEQEIGVPSIIFKNLLRIMKYYYPALAWMTSTIPDKDKHTRYDYYHRADTLKNGDFSGNLQSVSSELGRQKYYAVNTNYMGASGDKVTKFHLEFRFADCNLFPAHMACISILYKALVMKAISISKYGTLDMEEEIFDKIVKPLYVFKNSGNNSNRLSNGVQKETVDKLVALSVDLIMFLEKEIIAIDPIANKLLLKMCYEPPSVVFKRQNSIDYRTVNDYYDELVDTIVPKYDDSLIEIIRIIENTRIIADTEEEWAEMAGELIACKEPIKNIIEKIKQIVPMVFVEGVGYIVKS